MTTFVEGSSLLLRLQRKAFQQINNSLLYISLSVTRREKEIMKEQSECRKSLHFIMERKHEAASEKSFEAKENYVRNIKQEKLITLKGVENARAGG